MENNPEKPIPPRLVDYTDLEARIEHLALAIDLYKHEDLLNWSKLNNLFYVNIGLLAAAGFTLRGELQSLAINLPKAMILLISGIGLLVSLGFFVTLSAGVRYLQFRREKATKLERKLKKIGLTQILWDYGQNKIIAQSPTRLVLTGMPVLFTFIWAGIICCILCLPNLLG